jgi:hypothetical protein
MTEQPLGPWDHRFSFPEEMGCIPTLLGFLVFLTIALVLWHVFLN